jgi:hypothetical protein
VSAEALSLPAPNDTVNPSTLACMLAVVLQTNSVAHLPRTKVLAFPFERLAIRNILQTGTKARLAGWSIQHAQVLQVCQQVLLCMRAYVAAGLSWTPMPSTSCSAMALVVSTWMSLLMRVRWWPACLQSTRHVNALTT